MNLKQFKNKISKFFKKISGDESFLLWNMEHLLDNLHKNKQMLPLDMRKALLTLVSPWLFDCKIVIRRNINEARMTPGYTTCRSWTLSFSPPTPLIRERQEYYIVILCSVYQD